jgi:hypothetical protein
MTMPRTFLQAQLIEQMKKASSEWIKALDAQYRDFCGSAATAHFL